MRSLASFCAAVLVLALCAAAAPANYYYNAAAGYYQYNGYGQYYTRSLYTPAPYYNYGYWYYPAAYYVYTPYTPPAPAPAVAPPAVNSNWKSDVLKYAAARDENDLYLKALQAMGIQPPAGTAGYAYGNFVPQAATQYGYSLKSAIDIYGDGSTALAVQGLNRAMEQQQSNTADAFAKMNGTVQQFGANQRAVLEALAKVEDTKARGVSAAQALAAAQGSGVTITTTQNGTGTVPVQPATQPAVASGGLQVLQNRCAGCHSGDKAKAGFKVESWSTYSQDQKDAARLAILNPDLKARMPRDAAGNHVPLPAAEKAALLALP